MKTFSFETGVFRISVPAWENKMASLQSELPLHDED